MIESHKLPDFARDLRPPAGTVLASDLRPEQLIPTLEGEVHLLSQIDLQREGLSEYSSYIRTGGFSSHTSGGSHLHTTTDNFYDRASSSPPRNVIRTIVDSVQPHISGGGAYPSSNSPPSVYRSSNITDANNSGYHYSSSSTSNNRSQF